MLKHQTNIDGFEFQFGINHLAHFLLWQLIEPLVVVASQKEEARLIVLSSNGHKYAKLDWKNLPPSKGLFKKEKNLKKTCV